MYLQKKAKPTKCKKMHLYGGHFRSLELCSIIASNLRNHSAPNLFAATNVKGKIVFFKHQMSNILQICNNIIHFRHIVL